MAERSTETTLEGASSPRESLAETIAAGSSARRPRASLERGAAIGRYTVLRKLGAGGMGSVYAAYDPELDRTIALKLVRFGGESPSGEQRARLLREAQAMARVSHPHVVTVHDVGSHEDEIYVAMEFIDGDTLKGWSAAKQRPWREVLDVFRKAGMGLAAAHAEQIVHRDFKPENVMVSETGRVVVLDFGLARGSESPAPQAGKAGSGDSPLLLSTEITGVGEMAGTPAYMSPEQFAGAAVDALSDQFSYCVSLYGALFGERPFAGNTTAALAYSVTQGKIVEPAQHGVPRWLRAVVLRGLEPKRERRWPSMVELLEALDPGRRKNKQMAIGLGGGALIAVALAGAFGSLVPSTDLCSGAEKQLVGVWDDDRRGQARERAESLDIGWLAHTWDTTVAGLDVYAASWANAHRDACEASQIRGEQSDQMLDLRMGCLARARIDLEAATEQLLSLDRTGALRVHGLLDGLPSLGHCSDPAALGASVEPPSDAATQARVDTLRREISSARAAVRMGEQALEPLEGLRGQVEQAGYGPLKSEYFAALGEAQNFAGDREQGRAAFDQALHAALENRQWELAISTLHSLTATTGSDLRQPRAAMAYARVSEGIAAQPDIDPVSRRLSRRALGLALHESGEFEQAIEHYRAALTTVPEDRKLERAHMLSGLGMAVEVHGDLDEASDIYTEAKNLLIETLGPNHPKLANSHSAIGNVRMLQGRYEEAEREQRRALELDQSAFEPGHPAIARSHANLGSTLAAAGQYEQAEVEMRKVLEIIGESHPRAPMIHQNLGSNALWQGHFVEAEAEFRKALELYEGTLGTDHPKVLTVYSTLGSALDGQGRHDEAEPRHRRAVSMAVEAHGDKHLRTTTLRRRLGASLRKAGQLGEAVSILEQVLADSLKLKATSEKLSKAHFELAQALWDAGRDRTRARALARAALEDLGDESPNNQKKIRAWLTKTAG